MDELLSEREAEILGDPGKRALVIERRHRREAEHKVKKLERQLAEAQRALKQSVAE